MRNFLRVRFATAPKLMLALSAALSLGAVLLPGAAAAAAPGSPDTAFGAAGAAHGGNDVRLFGTTVQSDGKVVAVGVSGVQAGATLVVDRFTTSGALDGSFGSGGVARGPAISGALDTSSLGRSVAIQPDGKIVVVGKVTSSDSSGTDGILIERYNANGSLDTTFGAHGVVTALTSQLADGYAVALQPDGKIIATGSANAAGSGGNTPRVAVVRVSANGALDPSFGTGGLKVLDFGAYSTALAVALQRDGKIVLSGSQAPGLQVPNALLARLTTSGAPDASFAGGGAFAHQYANGAASSAFNAVAVQADGRIVAAGAATSGNTGADAIVTRFTAGGAPDGSFGSGGVVHTPSAAGATISGTVPGATGVGLASNGDIIAGGTVSNAGLTAIALWAFKPTGALDTAFGTGGATVSTLGTSTRAEGNGLAIGPDGKIVIAGDARPIVGAYSGIATRYLGFAPVIPPPPPALQASLTGVAGSYKTSAVAKRGLKIGVTCNEACSMKASLTISSGTARRLHILTAVKKCTKKKGKTHCTTTHVYRAVAIASAKGSLKGSGSTSLTLRLGKSYVKTLGKQKSVSVALQVIATATSTHKSKTINKSLTLKH